MNTIEIISLALASIVAILGGVWFIIQKAFAMGGNRKEIENKFKTIEKDQYLQKENIDRLPCVDHSKLFSDIRVDIAVIKASLQVGSPLTQSHSPIGLSELGGKVAKELSVQEKVEKNWHKIEPLIDEGTKSKNAYDIQQFCMEEPTVYPEKFFDEDSINEIKNYAFDSGGSLFMYMQMIGIIIRDEYFRKKGINKEEIDKHDPSKK